MNQLLANLAGLGKRAFPVALILLLAGCTPSVPSADTSPSATMPPSAPSASAATPTTTPSGSPIDTTSWTTYTSKRYGFSVMHPPDWTVTPAKHNWALATDADQVDSSGQDAFMSPEGDLRISLWATWIKTPNPDPEFPEIYGAIEEWVEKYCERSTSPCAGIQDRAVPLCNERRDCHPGLLVPFDSDIQAFFSGGLWNQKPPPPAGPRWTYVTVAVAWRGESWRPGPESSVAKYGGSRQLLDAFLYTMDVCPMRPGEYPLGCPEGAGQAGR